MLQHFSLNVLCGGLFVYRYMGNQATICRVILVTLSTLSSHVKKEHASKTTPESGLRISSSQKDASIFIFLEAENHLLRSSIC